MKKFLVFLAVLFLSLPLYAGAVKLAWDANSEPDLQGYKVHYSNGSRDYTEHVDVGNVTEATLWVSEEKTHYFAVTAYSVAGLESEYSNEVFAFVPLTEVVMLNFQKEGDTSKFMIVSNLPKGPVGGITVLCSTDLVWWRILDVITTDNGMYLFVDVLPPDTKQKFYKLRYSK